MEATETDTVKLWCVVPKHVADRLSELAGAKNRSRANLVRVIVEDAAFSPDADEAIKVYRRLSRKAR